MPGRRSPEELKNLGTGKPAPESVAALYRQAFAEFGVEALWNRRCADAPTIAQALVIADTLRREGSMKARTLGRHAPWPSASKRLAMPLSSDGNRQQGTQEDPTS